MLWYVAAVGVFSLWLFFAIRGFFGSRQIPDLSRIRIPEDRAALPRLSVVIPARNEEKRIRSALDSLVAQDFPNMEILVVNDRSTDTTGAIIDEIAAESNGRVRVEHLVELPDGWLGKCNALARGAEIATGDFILFTDADVLFSRDTLAHAMAHVVHENADFLTILPEMITCSPGERMMILGFVQAFSIAFPPWRAMAPRSNRFVGVGAFNLIRRSLYVRIGGHRFLRLQVVDDVGLGKLAKYSGGRVRVAFGAGMVKVRWQESLREMIRGLEKNAFASMRYSLCRVTGATVGALFLYWWPWIGMWFGPVPAQVLCALAALVVQPLSGVVSSQHIAVPVRYALTVAVGILPLLLALWRSTIVTLWAGGIRWRGTFYPLEELRQFKL